MSQLISSAHGATISQLKYLIGWICINPSEYYEAVKMFDEIHDSTRLIRGRDDNNSYDIGLIGHHLVVMNCPASGIYGQSRAAKIASDMRSTFPAIRFMLLVGTGGGAPSKNQDVRLGDVVLGTQLIPYHKRTVTDDGDEIIRRIATPPAILQSAITRLGSRLRQGVALHETIESIGSPPLPRPTQDRLYSAAYTHCPSHCDCLSAKVQALGSICPRKSRDRVDSVKVHQGAVGSADNAMRDAGRRDEYAGSLGILCYETEAHAIMETVSCLTVCGISEYCDGHEYNGWHAYASLSAAVCAKELLCTITDVASRCPLEVTPEELERWIQGTLEEVNHLIRQTAGPKHEYRAMDRNIDMVIERYGLVQEAISSKIYFLGSQVDPENARQLSDSVAAMNRLQKKLQKCLDALRDRVDQQVERQPKGSEMHGSWKLLRDRIDDWMRRDKEVAKAAHKILGNGRIGWFHDAGHKVPHANPQTTEPRKQSMGITFKSWFRSSGDKKKEQEKQANGSPATAAITATAETPSAASVTYPSAQQDGQIHRPEMTEKPSDDWVSKPPYLSPIPSLYEAGFWDSDDSAPMTEREERPSLPPRPSSTAIDDEDTPPPLPPRPSSPAVEDEACSPALPARPGPPIPPKLPVSEPPIPSASPPASSRGSRASAKSSRDSTIRHSQQSPSIPIEQTAEPPSTPQSVLPPTESLDSSPPTIPSPPLMMAAPPSSPQSPSSGGIQVSAESSQGSTTRQDQPSPPKPVKQKPTLPSISRSPYPPRESPDSLPTAVPTSPPKQTTAPLSYLQPIPRPREPSTSSSPATPPLPSEQANAASFTSQSTSSSPEKPSDRSSTDAPPPPLKQSLASSSALEPVPPPSPKEPSGPPPVAAPPPPPEQTIEPPLTPKSIPSPASESSDHSPADISTSVVIVVPSLEASEPPTLCTFHERRKFFEQNPVIMGLPRPHSMHAEN